MTMPHALTADTHSIETSWATIEKLGLPETLAVMYPAPNRPKDVLHVLARIDSPGGRRWAIGDTLTDAIENLANALLYPAFQVWTPCPFPFADQSRHAEIDR